MAGFVPPPPPPPSAPAAGALPQPSEEKIAAILARVDQEHESRFASERPAPPGVLGAWLKRGVIARLLFALAGLMLINNGLTGLRTRALESHSLIAVSINQQGGQSLGLGVAMLALAAMPSARQAKD